jgi:hypothetical protein
MFLVERLSGSSSSLPDRFPRRLSYGSGDLVRAALMASPAAEQAPAPARRAVQGELMLSAARQRKVG